MLRDLLQRARGPALHVAQANTYAQQVNMMSRIVVHNRLHDGSLINATCALGTKFNQSSKNQRMEGEILIVQSIQLGFMLSLGSTTSS